MNRHQSRQELEPSLRCALDQLLQAELPTGDQEIVIARVKQELPDPEDLHRVVRLRVSQRVWSFARLEFAAACLIGIVLSLVATTDAWGQVTRNFSDPFNEPSPITTTASELNRPAVPEKLPSFGMKLALLLHVGFLLLGLCGMTGSWCLSFVKHLLRRPRSRQNTLPKLMLEDRILTAGLVVYAAGTALGVFWSRITWGYYWQWSPQELFCVLSISIGLLWIGITRLGASSGERVEDNFEAAQKMSLVTIAFGTIMAMVPTASQFAASQLAASQGTRTYGLSSAFSFVMTTMAVFFAACIVAIWLPHFLGRKTIGEMK